MQVSVLASGSTGNAIYVQKGATRLLIDSGLSAREITKRLAAIGVELKKLNGILVSHEHHDHVGGVGVLARKLRCPVWMTRGTFDASRKRFKGRERIRLIENDETFEVGDLQARAFSISHDASDPVNYAIEDGSTQVAVATDMGKVTPLVYERLKAADMVIIESNYDRDLLMNGPYPWHLKQRISSSHGHLANSDSAEVLGQLAQQGLRHAVLAHLSLENNRPEIARSTCEEGLNGMNRHFQIDVASPDRPTPVFVV
jgi:phosphoribosyl 1,2-cyclic phosphodiesterase